MGYRSDVGFVLGFASKEECDSFIMAYKMKNPEFWKNMIATSWSRVSDCVLTGEYSSIKWEPDRFSNVDEVENMLEFATYNFNSAWQMMRVGEDEDDVESDNNHSDENVMFDVDGYVTITRSIFVENCGDKLD